MRRGQKALALVGVVIVGALVGCGRDDSGGTSRADAGSVGVTQEPCPDAVDEDLGCVYLGAITDLTGPFAGVSGPLLEGAQAFWSEVNHAGGVGGYEVDLGTFVRDNKYDPEVHAQAFSEIKDEVLAIGQSLGGPATRGMLADDDAQSLVVVPLTQSSDWLFEDRVLETGTSYCVDAMNAVDYVGEVDHVLAVRFPGDYGDDSARGAALAAINQGAEFTEVLAEPGSNQQAAVASILQRDPDLVLVSTGPTELAAIVGQATSRGYGGQFVASLPAWSAGLLETPAADALESQVLWVNAFPGYAARTPGHDRMREAAGDAEPNEWYAIGWTAQYALLAALEAVEGQPTRADLLAASGSLEEVDFEGMLPAGYGAYGADPDRAALRASNVFRPDRTADVGVVRADAAYVGPTARAHEFEEPCYQQ